MASCIIGYGGFHILNRPRRVRRTKRVVVDKNAFPVLAKKEGLPTKKLYWFGKRWPRVEDLEIMERFRLYALAWPRCTVLQPLTPRELLEHLRRVKNEQAETYVMLREKKIGRYLSQIQDELLALGTGFYLAATSARGELVSFYRYEVINGKGALWREWNKPELPGNVRSGCFRRVVNF